MSQSHPVGKRCWFPRFENTLIGLLCLTSLTGRIWSQEPQCPATRFRRETVVVDSDPAVIKQLMTVQDLIEQEQWQAAVQLIEQVRRASSDLLVPVAPAKLRADDRSHSANETSAGNNVASTIPISSDRPNSRNAHRPAANGSMPPSGFRRYLNGALDAAIVLSQFPAPGLETYRKTVDAQAAQWLETAAKNRDEVLLKKLLRRVFCSSSGDAALWLLAQWAWEDGRLAEAHRYWTQLLPLADGQSDGEQSTRLRYPDPRFDPASVRARLILCSLAQGHRERARRELTSFQQLHPAAKGELAGRSGNLTQILKSVIAASKNWPDRTSSGFPTTFALNDERNGTYPPRIDLGTIAWRVQLPADRSATDSLPRDRPAQRVLCYFPVVFNEKVFLSNSDAIFAFHLDTGTPAWPVGNTPSSMIYPSGQTEPVQPIQPLIGVPHYTMTIHNRRLYARMGPPITRRAKNEFRAPSELVGLDIDRGQGKLVWRVSTAELNREEPGWEFAGTPSISDGHLFVALTRSHPQVQTEIACFDLASTRMIWKRRICTSLLEPNERWNLIGHHLLTLVNDRIYFATDMGAIAALDRDDGTLRWVVTYPTQTDETPEQLNDPARHGLAPALYYEGRLAVAPQDSNAVFLLDAESGNAQWALHLPDRILYVLGVGRETLILSGRSLWGVDIATGHVVWRVGSGDAKESGYGRGFLAGNSVYWPTQTQILIVNQATGVIARRIQLDQTDGETGGNLAYANGMLFVAQSDRLMAFSQRRDGSHPGRNPPSLSPPVPPKLSKP